MQEFIEIVESSWNDNGFFGHLQEGVFNREALNELCHAMTKTTFEPHEDIPRQLVQHLWFMPVFMARKKAYIQNISSDTYDAARERIEELIAAIIGYP